MQKIDFFFSLLIELITPKAILTGRAAGTVMATRSRKETMTSSALSVFSS
jgi:hypothetical protein